MTINNLTDLENLEARIRLELSAYDLDEVLIAVRESFKDKEAFVLAGIASFGIRFSLPPIKKPARSRRIATKKFAYIYHLVKTYLLGEPSGFTSSANNEYRGSTLIAVLLRIAGNQFNFNVEFWGQYLRTLELYIEMPKKDKLEQKTPDVDISAIFQKLNKVSIEDFIHVGFVAYIAASARGGISGGYFQKARSQGFILPGDETIKMVLNQLAADQYQMRDIYEKYKQPERLYAAYDFNPLFVFPFVRPWIKTSTTSLDDDRLIAPVPSLVLYRLSNGIYHQLFGNYADKFSRYFGYCFERYVGEILAHCVKSNQLICEQDIRKTYPEKRGKVPDWVVITETTATLIECKAVGFNRKALATSDAKAIDYGIAPVIKGLIQLHEFMDACRNKVSGLEQFAHISEFQLRVVTYEPLHLINSFFFREVINSQISPSLMAKSIDIEDWHVLTIDELERVQPHMNCGITFEEIIEQLKTNLFTEVVEELNKKTGKTFKDSFLMTKHEQMLGKLGLTDRVKDVL